LKRDDFRLTIKYRIFFKSKFLLFEIPGIIFPFIYQEDAQKCIRYLFMLFVINIRSQEKHQL